MNKKDLKFAFGDVLREMRLERGLSQSELSRLSDTDRPYISVLESGRKMPTLETLLRFSRVLGADPGEVMNRIDRKMKAKESGERPPLMRR